jgi:hypothetical protein
MLYAPKHHQNKSSIIWDPRQVMLATPLTFPTKFVVPEELYRLGVQEQLIKCEFRSSQLSNV